MPMTGAISVAMSIAPMLVATLLPRSPAQAMTVARSTTSTTGCCVNPSLRIEPGKQFRKLNVVKGAASTKAHRR